MSALSIWQWINNPLGRRIAIALVIGALAALFLVWLDGQTNKRIRLAVEQATQAQAAAYAKRDAAALEDLRRQIALQEQVARVTDATLAELLAKLRASKDNELKGLADDIETARYEDDCGPLAERLRKSGRAQIAFASCFANGARSQGPAGVLPAGPTSPANAGAG